ncbi:SAM-dependent methyltransferase [Kitasatospora sp. GAS1066B]|uniref:SAM-dependent methyltransferase n=1 Tax=Kitasatospora sp. GAS1066B TaxID=3156271 RepID=UPI0035181062
MTAPQTRQSPRAHRSPAVDSGAGVSYCEAPRTALETGRPSPARITDHLLGGKDALPTDRRAAERLIAAVPTIGQAVQARRWFVERAVRHLAREEDVREWLVLGAGLPTQPPLHAVIQEEQPDARVLHIDADPLVLSHLRARLSCPLPGRLTVAQGDLREPAVLLGTDAMRQALDAGRPVAVVLETVLEHIPDQEDPAGLVAELVEALPSGSFVVVSHATADFAPAMWALLVEIYESVGIPIVPRREEDVAALLDGLLLPGLVPVNQWHPDDQAMAVLSPEVVSRYGAIGRVGQPSAVGVR